MILGKCPYCKGNVHAIKSTANGKKVNLYSCENAKKSTMIVNSLFLLLILLVLLEYIQMYSCDGIKEVSQNMK